MPLDGFAYVESEVTVKKYVVPGSSPEIVAEFQRIIDETASDPAKVRGVERHAFYEEAKKAYAIVQTAETRLYGNIILSKGVVPPG